MSSPPSAPTPGQPLILLVHGMWMGAWIWDDVVDALGEAGLGNGRTHDGRAEVRAIDLPGHGDEPTDTSTTDVPQHIDAVVDVLEAHRSVDPASPRILVGHSMGTLVAMQAAQRSEVDALVLINPGPPRGVRLLPRWLLPHLLTVILPSALRRSASRLSLAQATRFMLHPLSATRRETVHAQLGPEAPATIREVVWILSPSSPLGDPRPLAAADVTVVAGTDDRIAPADQLLPAFEDWAGDVRSFRLDGIGHLAPIEAPATIADLIRSTLTNATIAHPTGAPA